MRTLMTGTLFALSAVASAAAQNTNESWLRRCERDSYNNDREVHCEVRVSGFRPARGVLSFEPGTNGGVQVEGWDRDSVAVHARIRGNAEDVADARALARGVTIGRSGNTVTAEVPSSNGRRESVSVELVVYVPTRSDLSIETANGPLSVYNVSGEMDLFTKNGPLSLEAVGGNVRARTQNGPLSVELYGARWQGEGLDAETSNGPATIAIPERYNAQLEVGTQNGPFNVDFPLTVTLRGGRVGRHINTTLGSGGAPIRIVTTNGPLHVRRN